LHPSLLKELADQLAYPLTQIFNKSLSVGKLPSNWKEAHVTPIHKKGSRTEPGNYRPVSLTSVVGKVLESIIRDILVDHFMVNNLFTDSQHGFVPKRSCTTQLLDVMNDWSLSLERGESVDSVYLDFRKAFDSVPHQRLLVKLKAYGIDGTLLTWMRDFLHQRRQRVVINGSQSPWCEVTSGIPQGSVLGPTLFVVYINDLPDVITSTVKIFADDSKIYRPICSHADQVALQRDLCAVEHWSEIWQLPFNAGKCKILHLGSKNQRAKYTLGGHELEQTRVEKDLGLAVDDQLKFHVNTAAAALKGNQVLGLVKRAFTNLDESSVPILYKCMVRPHLEYANVVWGPHFSTDQKIIERVQHRATRLVPSLKGMPYSSRLRKLKLPTLKYRRERGDMIQLYKIMTKKERIDPESFFELANLDKTRGHCFKIKVPLARSNVRRQSFSARTVRLWNSLPEEVVTANSVNAFKTMLDKFWEHKRYKE